VQFNNGDEFIYEAEVIKVCDQVATLYSKEILKGYRIRISSTEIVDAILDEARVSLENRLPVLQILSTLETKTWNEVKKELSSTQQDVEAELVSLRDADLAHLISLGGWIRALEVSTVAVEKQFSEERARKVMREDIADYYTESIGGLEPKISERPNYIAMREVLSGLRTGMVLEEGKPPTIEIIKDIRQQAAKLVELALQRQQ
jgi:hypothetical protein